ncbi:MAG: hypothetical protein AAGC93_09435 [Cyanobacteria bacterium P01_F01_bin.53]
MVSPQIFEWPHPQIDEDWNSGQQQWREITYLAYKELKAAVPLRCEVKNAFMQAEPVDILPDGDGLYVCCKHENGFYFARLMPGEDWWKRDYVPLPETAPLF